MGKLPPDFCELKSQAARKRIHQVSGFAQLPQDVGPFGNPGLSVSATSGNSSGFIPRQGGPLLPKRHVQVYFCGFLVDPRQECNEWTPSAVIMRCWVNISLLPFGRT